MQGLTTALQLACDAIAESQIKKKKKNDVEILTPTGIHHPNLKQKIVQP